MTTTKYLVGDGKPNTTIAEAIVAIKADLTNGDLRTGGGGVRLIEIYAGGNHVGDAYQYDETVNASGGFTNASATDKIVINGMVAHNGLRDTGIVVRARVQDTNGFVVTDYTEVNDISITRQGVSALPLIVGLLLGPYAKVNRILVYDQITSGDNLWAAIYAEYGYNEITNCAVMNCGVTSSNNAHTWGIWADGPDCVIHNTTVINILSGASGEEDGIGIRMSVSGVTVTNTIVVGSTLTDFAWVGDGSPVVTYCISSDDTAADWDPPGVGNQINKDPVTDIKFTNTSAGTEDIHLLKCSCAIDAGIVQADATVDLEGNDRGCPGETCEVGADERTVPVRWKRICESAYTATPTSIMTIAMSDTSGMAVGLPLKYTYGGTTYYGIVSLVTANTSIMLNGAPLDTEQDLTALYVGTPEMQKTLHFLISGDFGDGVADLLAADNNEFYMWSGPAAHLVAFGVICKTSDTGGPPHINVKIGNNLVSTENGDLGIWASSSTWIGTGVFMNTSNYNIANADAVEVRCTQKGVNENASDLSVMLYFVLD